MLLQIPLLLVGLWVVLLMLRKLWAAESAPDRTLGQNLRRALLAPQSNMGRFYRWFLIAVFSLLGINLIFVSFSTGASPTWLLIASDLLVSGALLIALFAYMSSQVAPTGLEIRVVGAGLTIFLGLVSLLGWIITLTYLRQEAPGVQPDQVFGSQMQAQFFVTPAAYRDLARGLSDLLAPLLWFELTGSFFFIGANISLLSPHLEALPQPDHRRFRAGAARQPGLSHPRHRLAGRVQPDRGLLQPDDRGLEQANMELRTYQQHLQALVDQRTAELGREMELRKRLELRQAIQDERARIAQETHDGLLQTLMGVRIRLNRGKRLSQMEAGAIQAELAELAGEITQSVQDLRHLIQELNEQILPDGLVPAWSRSSSASSGPIPSPSIRPGLPDRPIALESRTGHPAHRARGADQRHPPRQRHRSLDLLGCDYQNGTPVAIQFRCMTTDRASI